MNATWPMNHRDCVLSIDIPGD